MGLPANRSRLAHPAPPGVESGAHLRLVRDQMGHSTVAITADLYGAHVDPNRQVRAVEELDRTLGLAPERPQAPPEGENAG
jgi:hypothetical protein